MQTHTTTISGLCTHNFAGLAYFPWTSLDINPKLESGLKLEVDTIIELRRYHIFLSVPHPKGNNIVLCLEL